MNIENEVLRPEEEKSYRTSEKAQLSLDVEAQIKAFFANKGEIQVIPPGVSTESPDMGHRIQSERAFRKGRA